MLQPTYATTKIRRIPLGSARAGVEDDSQADYMATDTGTDMTMSWICDSVKDRGTDLFSRTRAGQNSSQGDVSVAGENKNVRLEGNKLQICPCGWQKVTSVRGLRMHQGRKRCVVKERQCGRIERYFLRSQSNKSDEVQRQVENHSSKDINNTATEVEVEVVRRDAAETDVNRPVSERNMEQKARVKWPRANSRKEWETVNRDLSVILSRLGGNRTCRPST